MKTEEMFAPVVNLCPLGQVFLEVEESQEKLEGLVKQGILTKAGADFLLKEWRKCFLVPEFKKIETPLRELVRDERTREKEEGRKIAPRGSVNLHLMTKEQRREYDRNRIASLRKKALERQRAA